MMEVKVSIPNIPKLATGGTITRGGYALVGERGPELVSLPTGSTVYDAYQTAVAGRGVTVYQNINAAPAFDADDLSDILSARINAGMFIAGVR